MIDAALTTTYITAQEKIKLLQEQAKAEVEATLKRAFADFFAKYSDYIVSISWTQHTPSFNDGDPCYFRVSELSAVSTTNEDEEWYVENTEELPEIGDDFEALASLIFVIDEAYLQALFGDGSTIIVTKDEITVDEYYGDY